MADFKKMFQQTSLPKDAVKNVKIQNVHYTKLYSSPFQYRDISQEDVEALADLIEADGGVLQPLLIRKNGADSYEILAGHKRYRACKHLAVDRKEEKYAMIPCIVAAMDDIHAEFAVYSTNGYGTKTPYEQMKEIEGMMALMQQHPEAFPDAGSGRTVEKLARQLDMSRSVISDYQNISHNLGKKGMEAFQAGTINKSGAVALAGVDEETQEDILNQGLTQAKDIKKYCADARKAEAESEPEPAVSDSLEQKTAPLVDEEQPDPALTQNEMDDLIIEIMDSLDKKQKDHIFQLYYEDRDVPIDEVIELLSGTQVRDSHFTFLFQKEGIRLEHFGELELTISYTDFMENMIRLYDLESGFVFNALEHDSIPIEYKLHGNCPYCGETLYWPIHENFCSHCGKEIFWPW